MFANGSSVISGVAQLILSFTLTNKHIDNLPAPLDFSMDKKPEIESAMYRNEKIDLEKRI